MGLFEHSNLTFKKRSDMSIFNDTIESLFIEISDPSIKEKFIIGIIYRPPDGAVNDFISHLNDILNTISSQNYHAYIMGDFSIDMLNSVSSTNFLNTLMSHGFEPTINKPTSVSGTSATLIDNIFTNINGSMMSGTFVTDLSDHLPVFLKFIKEECDQNGSITFRDYSTRNKDLFSATLADKTWEDVLQVANVNLAYDILFDHLNLAYNTCFPVKRVKKNKKRRKKQPWITQGILISIRKKHKLLRSYLKFPSLENHKVYKSHRNKLNNVIQHFPNVLITLEYLENVEMMLKKHGII